MWVNVLLQALFHKVWIRFQAPAEAFLLLCKVNSNVGVTITGGESKPFDLQLLFNSQKGRV